VLQVAARVVMTLQATSCGAMVMQPALLRHCDVVIRVVATLRRCSSRYCDAVALQLTLLQAAMMWCYGATARVAVTL
jgi:hypothetical protein